MSTLERTKQVVALCLGQAIADIRPESRLVIDLGAESIDLLELVFLLEEEFHIQLQSDELIPESRDARKAVVERLTVGDIAAVLESKLSPGPVGVPPSGGTVILPGSLAQPPEGGTPAATV